MSAFNEDFQERGAGHGSGKRLLLAGLSSATLPFPLPPPKFCVQKRENRANLRFYTPFFCFSVSLRTRCWLGLKMPPLSIFSFAEEPLMEPCLSLQPGVFNRCDCHTFSLCVCVCLEPDGGLLMVLMMMMVVMMMMRWLWRCLRGFWLSCPCLLKDSLR